MSKIAHRIKSCDPKGFCAVARPALGGRGKPPIEYQCKPLFTPQEIRDLKIPRAEQMEVCAWKCVRPFKIARLRAMKDPKNFAIVHRSTKEPGRWQLSLFDAQGPWGDRIRDTCSEAADELKHVFRRWEVTDWE